MADAFYFACNSGELEKVRDFLAQGGDPNALDSGGFPAVFGAAQGGQVAVLELLLGTGRLRIDAPNPNGATALFIAAQEGLAEVVGLLIEGGASVDAAMNDGRTPL